MFAQFSNAVIILRECATQLDLSTPRCFLCNILHADDTALHLHYLDTHPNYARYRDEFKPSHINLTIMLAMMDPTFDYPFFRYLSELPFNPSSLAYLTAEMAEVTLATEAIEQ